LGDCVATVFLLACQQNSRKVLQRPAALLRTLPEYVWLGDYPKEAERRKQGYMLPAGVK
jgi:hypothetical protein